MAVHLIAAMLATLGGIFALLLGLLILLLPLLTPELSRPRDSFWGAVVLLLGLVLVTSSERLGGAPMLAVLSGGLLIGRLGSEVGLGRWRALSDEERQRLLSLERWQTSLEQLLAVIARLTAGLGALNAWIAERRQPRSNGKRWVRAARDSSDGTPTASQTPASEPDPEPDPAPKPQPEPEASQQPLPPAETEQGAEPQPEAAATPEPEPESKFKSEPEPEPRAKAPAEAEAEPEIEAIAEAEREPAPPSEAGPAATTVTSPDPDTPLEAADQPATEELPAAISVPDFEAIEVLLQAAPAAAAGPAPGPAPGPEAGPDPEITAAIEEVEVEVLDVAGDGAG